VRVEELLRKNPWPSEEYSASVRSLDAPHLVLTLGQADASLLDVSARSLLGQQLLCLLGVILNCSKWGNSARWEQIQQA